MNASQNFSETYSLTLWLLQKTTLSGYLERETWKILKPLISYLLVECKKTVTFFNTSGLCKILCRFRYYSRRLDTQKKDKSFALRNGKCSHWFAPGRKMQRYYHSLEVLCFARCHFRAHYQKAPGYSKACKRDHVLLLCPVDRLFC